MTYKINGGVERNCPLFSEYKSLASCCIHSGCCDSLREQEMYHDSHYNLGTCCLGINDENRLDEMKKLCLGEPMKEKDFPRFKKV